MCYTGSKIEGGVGELRKSDDTSFLKPNGQSRNLNFYGEDEGEDKLVMWLRHFSTIRV